MGAAKRPPSLYRVKYRPMNIKSGKNEIYYSRLELVSDYVQTIKFTNFTFRPHGVKYRYNAELKNLKQ